MSDFIVDYDRNRRADALGLDVLPASWGEGYDASFEEQMARSPLRTYLNHREREQYIGWGDFDENGEFVQTIPKDSRILTKQEANEQYGIEGKLTFDADTPEPVAQQLHRLNVEELLRQDIRRRSTAGIGADLLAGILTTVNDPLYLGSMFIGLGETRLAASAGPAISRLVTGAAEGAVGAAALEPLVLAGAEAESADYTAADSLMNIVLGSVISGGLHLGAGAIGDRMAGRREAPPIAEMLDQAPPEHRAAVITTAARQIEEGRPVDVAPVMEAVAENVERRQLSAIRRDIATIEDPVERARAVAEMRSAALTEPLTGLGNRLAMLDHMDRLAQGGEYHALSLDVAGLKWANDTVHEAFGDELIKKAAEVLREAGAEADIPIFRPKGDEYYAFARTEGELQKLMQAAEPKLRGAHIEAVLPDGTILQKWGIDLYSGVGKTREIADAELNKSKERYKAARKAEIEAAGGDYRLAEPAGVVRLPAQGNAVARDLAGGEGVQTATQRGVTWAEQQRQPYVAPEIKAGIDSAAEAAKLESGAPKALDREVQDAADDLMDIDSRLSEEDYAAYDAAPEEGVPSQAEIEAMDAQQATYEKVVKQAANCLTGRR